VLNHYRTGITITPNLDTLLTSGISLSEENKADIIEFLKTLTDTTFTRDKRFAEPK
jgi:cytochrome c peroxidase